MRGGVEMGVAVVKSAMWVEMGMAVVKSAMWVEMGMAVVKSGRSGGDGYGGGEASEVGWRWVWRW